MSERTGAFLHTLVTDAFKREVDSDEAVWRSLPLFAAVAGLAAAVFPGVYASAASASPNWVKIVALVLLAGSLSVFGRGGYWFWQLVKVREYVFPRSDTGLVSYAEDLASFYADGGAAAEEADEAIRNEVRDFMTAEFAAAVEINRSHNRIRVRARSQVLIHVTIAFVLAFAAEATILSAQALSPAWRGSREEASRGRVEQDRPRALGTAPRGSPTSGDAAGVRARLDRRDAVAVHPPGAQGGRLISAPDDRR